MLRGRYISMAENNNKQYGAELGAGIKEGMKGLNTVCSPKNRKKCLRLLAIPLLCFYVLLILSAITKADAIIGIMAVAGFCLGLYQFYVGRIGKGILYTITCGLFTVGALFDLFRLAVTKTFKDSNGFPLLY